MIAPQKSTTGIEHVKAEANRSPADSIWKTKKHT